MSLPTPPQRAVERSELLERLGDLLPALGHGTSALGRPLRVVCMGAGAWGSVFTAMLQEMYGAHDDLVDIRIWRRGGRSVPKDVVGSLLAVINSREDVLRRLRNDSVYLKYVSGPSGAAVQNLCSRISLHPLTPPLSSSPQAAWATAT